MLTNQKKLIDTKRTIEQLDLVSGVHSKQVNDAMSQILRVMDKHSMVNQRGYEIFRIQILALKIYDEEETEKNPSKYLDFYITQYESEYYSLNDSAIQSFIIRIKKLPEDAEGVYYTILKNKEEKRSIFITKAILLLLPKP